MKNIKKIITTTLILLPIIGIIYVGINADSIGAKIEQKEAANKAEIAKEHKIDKSKWEYIGDLSISEHGNEIILKEFFDFTDAEYFYINPQVVTGAYLESHKKYGVNKFDNFQFYKVEKEQMENIYHNMLDIANYEYFQNQPSKKQELYDIDKVKKLVERSIEKSFSGNSVDLANYENSKYMNEFIWLCRQLNDSFGADFLETLEYYKEHKIETKCENIKINQVGLAKNNCDIGGAYIFGGTFEIETLKAEKGFEGNRFIPKVNEKRTVEFAYMARGIDDLQDKLFGLYFATDY